MVKTGTKIVLGVAGAAILIFLLTRTKKEISPETDVDQKDEGADDGLPVALPILLPGVPGEPVLRMPVMGDLQEPAFNQPIIRLPVIQPFMP